jgi:type IV secretory pathway VirB2 component (pilin)
MPWESPLTTLKNSLTGPVALVLSILGVLVCGAMLIFGSQINDFVRGVVVLVLVVSMIIAASNFLSALGFGSGATIGEEGGNRDGITQSADSSGQ